MFQDIVFVVTRSWHRHTSWAERGTACTFRYPKPFTSPWIARPWCHSRYGDAAINIPWPLCHNTDTAQRTGYKYSFHCTWSLKGSGGDSRSRTGRRERGWSFRAGLSSSTGRRGVEGASSSETCWKTLGEIMSTTPSHKRGCRGANGEAIWRKKSALIWTLSKSSCPPPTPPAKYIHHRADCRAAPRFARVC